MLAFFRGFDKLRPNRWSLALLLTAFMTLPACQPLNGSKQSLRKHDLAHAAQHARSDKNIDKEIDKARKPNETDDFLMSSEAKSIYHNLD